MNIKGKSTAKKIFHLKMMTMSVTCMICIGSEKKTENAMKQQCIIQVLIVAKHTLKQRK